MRTKLLVFLSSIAALVAACGNGGGNTIDGARADGPVADARPIDAIQIDARPADLACINGPLPDAPPAVPNPLVVSGSVSELLGGDVVGATVSAHAKANNQQVATATSDANAAYSLSINTNNVPFDGYLKATFTGLLDSYTYPPAPLAADLTGADIAMISADNLGRLALFAQATVTPGTAVVGVSVVDCAGLPVIGATVSFDTADGNTEVVYGNEATGIPDPRLTATDGSGLAIGFSVPGQNTGTTTVTVDYQGTLFSNTFTAWPDSLIIILVAP